MALRRKRNLLRETRFAKKLSGYDLEILSHVRASEIYRIERGIRPAQPYEKRLLAEALGVNVEELFPRELERNKEVEGLIQTGSGCHRAKAGNARLPEN